MPPIKNRPWQEDGSGAGFHVQLLSGLVCIWQDSLSTFELSLNFASSALYTE